MGGADTNHSWIPTAGRAIAGAIVDTCRIINPTAVIVYAEPHPRAADLIEVVASEARRQVMLTLPRPPRVMKAALAIRGPLVGALALAADAAEAPVAWEQRSSLSGLAGF